MDQLPVYRTESLPTFVMYTEMSDNRKLTFNSAPAPDLAVVARSRYCDSITPLYILRRFLLFIFSSHVLATHVRVRYMLSPVRLSSVTLVHPTQAVVIFDNFSKAFGTLTCTENFMEIVPGEPLRRGS